MCFHSLGSNVWHHARRYSDVECMPLLNPDGGSGLALRLTFDSTSYACFNQHFIQTRYSIDLIQPSEIWQVIPTTILDASSDAVCRLLLNGG